MAEDRRSWVGRLAWGFVVGALLVLVVRMMYLILRTMWDYRREITPTAPLFVGLSVVGSSSFPAGARALAVMLALGLALLLARNLWSPASLAAGRVERFLSVIRRAWPRIAARSVGGRAGAWRSVRAAPSPQGVDLEVLTPVGFSAQDVAYRADAVAAAYSAAWCSVMRDPHRANVVRVSICWSQTPTPLRHHPMSQGTPRAARP